MAPERTCVGCRKALPAEQLVRVVRLEGGALAVDRHGSGRGAWLCRGSLGCLERAAQREAFGRALRAPVQADAVEALRRELGASWERPTGDVRG